MRIAVAGGTGLIGRHTVEALSRAGHEAVVVARSRGVDVTTGKGLDDALAGVGSVIVVTNTAATGATDAQEFFSRVTERLLRAEQRAGWGNRGGTTAVSSRRVQPTTILLVQPIAVSDVARVLAEIAGGPPREGVLDVAGPEPQDLVDMARRTLVARGDRVRLVPSWRGGPFGVDMAGEVLLPGPAARIVPTTFDAWLATSGGTDKQTTS
jgi:uncharacterized protein YbjT (DUF2867 family)